MKKRVKERGKILVSALVLTVVFLYCISFASAGVSRGTPFFSFSQESYGAGQTLEGWLNFSLIKEPGESIVSVSVSDTKAEMKLLNFLKESGAVYICNPSNCLVVYDLSNPEKQKDFGLGVGEDYFSIKATRKEVEINNLEFSLSGTSSAGHTCGESPLKLDLLDDGTVDWEYKESGDWCSNLYSSSCFSISDTDDSVMGATPYCQQMTLEKTGKVKVGAYLKKVSGYNIGDDLKFFITDLNGDIKGECAGLYVSREEYRLYSCDIESDENSDFYIDKKGNYFVCVKQDGNMGEGGVKYAIKSEALGSVCGFYGNPPHEFNSDYAIYAQVAGFAPFSSSVVFDKDTFLDGSLLLYVQNFIDSKYSGDCSGTKGCVIPLRIVSKAEQDLELSDLDFSYSSSTGDVLDDDFYDTLLVWPKLGMDRQALAFSVLNLSAPEQSRQYTATARVGSASGTARFKVEEVPIIQSLTPIFAVPGKLTRFRVVAVSPDNLDIVEYEWNWGDGTGSETTSVSEASHTYYNAGTFTLVVKVKDSSGLVGSRSFVINTQITKKTLNLTILDLKQRLADFAVDYDTLEFWYRDMLGFNITGMNNSLLALEQDLEGASTQSELLDIKNQLDNLNVPISIDDSMVLRESTYIVNLDNIDPGHIEILSGSDYSSSLESQYQGAIAFWQEDNFDIEISGSVKTVAYEGYVDDAISVVKFSIDPKDYPSGETYVVFQLPSVVSPEDVVVNSNADSESQLTGAVGLTFYDLNGYEVVEFAVPGKRDFATLTLFVSPALDVLQITPGNGGGDGGKPLGLAISLIVLVIIGLGLALWFIWKGHGKDMGGGKLFKNPMDLYNIFTVISTNDATGVPRAQTIRQLEDSGWTKKQINYALKKLRKDKGRSKRPSLPSFGQRPRRPTRPTRFSPYRR